ncbi:MAG TPA: nucleotidyltransferase family protein [Verrucomicrobiae bacterium]|nr:nucleotidyltransferase family protein [Verrucomicrobiae bacterium]
MPIALTSLFSPELQRLSRICGIGRGPRAQTGPADSLQELARQQQVEPLLWNWQDRALAAAPSPPEWVAQRSQHSATALQLTAETARLGKVFDTANIEVIALKGPLLAKQYYGDLALRHVGDIDLLVARDSIDAADVLLQKSGYQRTKPLRALSPARFALYVATQHEFGYLDPTTGTAVELHWRYADAAGLQADTFRALWTRSTIATVGAVPVRTLAPIDTLMQLAVHGALDGWSRLKWLADLPRVAAHTNSSQIEQLRTRASTNGLARILDLALYLAGSDAVTTSVAPWMERVLEYVAWRVQNPHPRELAARARILHSVTCSRYMNALLVDSHLLAQHRYVSQIMPRDFDALPLPDVFTPTLPYVARVTRAFRAVARRSG